MAVVTDRIESVSGDLGSIPGLARLLKVKKGLWKAVTDIAVTDPLAELDSAEQQVIANSTLALCYKK